MQRAQVGLESQTPTIQIMSTNHLAKGISHLVKINWRHHDRTINYLNFLKDFKVADCISHFFSFPLS